MTIYRIYDGISVFGKLALPLLVIYQPIVMIFFALLTYGVMGGHYVTYHYYFPRVSPRWNRSIAFAMLMRPLYDYLVWISQLAAFPRAMSLRLKPRTTLAAFVEEASATALGRVPEHVRSR